MARSVSEVMNRELVFAQEGTSAHAIRDLVLAMGITAVPVLDGDRRPIGVLSLRDLVDLGSTPPHPSRPAAAVRENATLEEAGKALAQTDYHHLVVVDAGGRAVGMLSALDVLRGLLGVPARHPAAFPHMDPELGVSWTDDELLELDRLSDAPEGGGVIVLVRGGRRAPETPVWVEACERTRTRLEELLTIPQSDSPALAALLAHGGLRYRAAAIVDATRRARVLAVLQERIGHQPLPAGLV
jgi:CBS domain-containing protein